MHKCTLSLALILLCIVARAQHFSHAYRFFDSLTSSVEFNIVNHCLIDNNDNLYTIVQGGYENLWTDSLIGLGTVNIKRGQASLVDFSLIITKHLPNGAFVLFNEIEYYSDLGNNTTLTGYETVHSFATDNNNNIIGYVNFDGADSIVLRNADRSIFSTFYTYDSTNTLVLVFKLDSLGQFVWANTIQYKRPIQNKQKQFDLACRGVFINTSNEIVTSIDFNQFVPPINDTLILTQHTNIISNLLVNNADINLKFSPSGNVLHQYNSFRLLNQNEASNTQVLKATTRGSNSYQLVTVKLPSKDTLLFNQQQLALKAGTNLLLLKRSGNDSIEWIRILGNGSLNYLYSFDIDASVRFDRIVVGFSFIKDSFLLSNPIAVPVNENFGRSFSLNYIAQFDLSGQFLNHQIVGGINSVNLVIAATLNPVTGNIDLLTKAQWVGTYSSDFYVGNTRMFTFDNSASELTMVLLDSNLKGLDAFLLSKRLDFVDIGKDIYYGRSFLSPQYELPYYGIGSNNYDSRGRIYIPGKYSKFRLNCNLSLPPNVGNNPDGFVLVSKLPRSVIDTFVCKQLVSPSGRYTWDTSGFYYDTIPDYIGCDSVIMLSLKVLKSKHTIDTAVCIKYISPSGKIFDTTGSYTDTITNSKGCDSIIMINLAVNRTKLSFDTTHCAPIKSPSGKYTYSISGVYQDTLLNTKNCDSLITINFTRIFINDSIQLSSCKNILSPSGRFMLTQSGTYYDTLQTSEGCDSVLKIVFIKQFITSAIDTFSCKPIRAPSGKFLLTITGSFYDTVNSVQNCDSVILLNFTLGEQYSSIKRTICDSLLSPSKKYVYRSSGLYNDTILTSSNCDSIITIEVELKPLTLTLTKTNDITCSTPTALLTAQGGTYYKWEPSYLLQGASTSTPTAIPEITTVFTVIVNDTLGCSKTDTIAVNVDKQEDIKPLPNVFSPNDDGLNDCISPSFITDFKTLSFTVYNRWGQKVFETNSSKACWDGKDQTSLEVSAGVYLYILEGVSACNSKVTQRGTITLIR